MTPNQISAQSVKSGLAQNGLNTSVKKRLADSMALPAPGETSAKKPKVEEDQLPQPKPMNALAKILAERKAAAALAAATGIPQVFPSVGRILPSCQPAKC